MWTIHRVLVDPFIASFKAPPKQLVLDVDATDEAVHGQQQGRFFHGYYDHDCFLPLYEFGGDPLLAAYLRSSKIDAAKHAWAILALLARRLRKAWQRIGEEQRVFGEFHYAAATWDCQRRIILKGEYGPMGTNTRYLVKSLASAPKKPYDQVYCARGEVENRIKQQPLELFVDRTNCHAWWPN